MNLQTAQAETNNPQWAKAIEMIYPKAKEMMSKPRYWHVAFPLVITSLCVAPQTYFLKNWVPCFEVALSKVKVCLTVFLLSLSHPCEGKTIPDSCHERDDKIALDLLVPLSGISFNDANKAGWLVKALLPREPSDSLPCGRSS